MSTPLTPPLVSKFPVSTSAQIAIGTRCRAEAVGRLQTRSGTMLHTERPTHGRNYRRHKTQGCGPPTVLSIEIPFKTSEATSARNESGNTHRIRTIVGTGRTERYGTINRTGDTSFKTREGHCFTWCVCQLSLSKNRCWHTHPAGTCSGKECGEIAHCAQENVAGVV